MKSVASAAAPGRFGSCTLVGSWFCGRYVDPRGTVLTFTLSNWLKLWLPTYSTSSDDDHGSAICTPPFHCPEVGIFVSNSSIVIEGGDCRSNGEPARSVNRLLRTEIVCTDVGLTDCPKIWLPSDRS